MLPEKIYKTVCQHNKLPIEAETMRKLQVIAEDCRIVKNYVYQRYGGIKSLSKLYPGYTIQNEMTESGLREALSMPSVYFYLAVFDALGDIKSEWTRTKKRVLERIKKNKRFREEELHYLRFVLKVNNVFNGILNYTEELENGLPEEMQMQYQTLTKAVEKNSLDNYLRREIRKCLRKLHTEQANGFSISPKAYRYKDDGIYISTKEKRKRVFILLTDKNTYHSQIYIRLYQEESRIELHVPITVSSHIHSDYKNEIGTVLGMQVMLTTDSGNRYGEELGTYQIAYADWMREQTMRFCKNRQANSGRKKYNRQKQKKGEQLHNYINRELNRFIKTEKPKNIYIPKLPQPNAGGVNKKINYTVTLWQRGYIRKRLELKCMENSINLIEVIGKDISNLCSSCGGHGKKEKGFFICRICNRKIEIKMNAAQNAKKRGQNKEIIYK